MPLHQPLLLLTGALLLALLALGLRLQLGWSQSRVRWPHHALFFAVCAGTLLAAVLAQLAGQRGWALGPALALLLAMPRTRPGRSDHWRRALACAGAYGLGAWLAWG
ncbi:hypothetical protein [Deinococcus multiflagellatus]|uniref:Uncharacterized protein n=1 Tax=Deinococcus multiflagellatus TaxID=1656887 RepID=A0ABW1ZPE9_9DEIO|nr:hypothetical protein [Deinococcus multiflagellatus]MBZ9715093.1 hypothetical protein [Deinococcus multiflagellatus]